MFNLNRRQFIIGSTALTLAPISSFAVDEVNNDNSVIYIFLSGGISSYEFIDPLPDAPVEFRAVNGHIMSKGGYLMGADVPHLAGIGDKLTVVRSFHHSDASHASATMWVNTSHRHLPQSTQKEPSYGSIASHHFGSNHPLTGMPSYVKTSSMRGDEASWLGVNYGGYSSNREAVANLTLRSDRDRFTDRLALKKGLSSTPLYGKAVDWDVLSNQAEGIVQGDVAKAFDTSLENEAIRSKYVGGFGKQALLAKRLVSNGARFVTLVHSGWDHHSKLSKSFTARMSDFDVNVKNLILDLQDEGLLDKTLVVISSEFSRTNKINGNAGRDHKPSTNTLVFAGGRYNHGQAIGRTDKVGSSVVENPYGPTDLAWTIGNHLGIDKSLTISDGADRPRHIFNHEAKNILS